MRIMILAIAVLLVVSACAESPTGQIIGTNDISDEQTKLCAILPLSGEFTIFGQDIARGFELAAAELAEKEDIELELIFEDDAYDPKRSATAAMKLKNVDDCPAIIAPFVETAKPILPMVQDKNIPVIMILDQNSIVKDEPQLFSIGYSIEGASEKISRFARNIGAKNAVVLYDQIEFTVLSGEQFSADFESHGGVVLKTWELVPGEDFRTIVTQIMKLNPDVVYFGMGYNDQPSFIKRLREQGFNGLVLGPNSYLDDFIMAAGEAAENTCKTDLPPIAPDRAEHVQQMYIAKYGAEPIALKYVMLSYDMTYVYADAIRRGGLDHLGEVEGVMSSFGEELSLADDGATHRVESIYCVEDGEIVLVER